jgi:tRNA-dihydrouridine synthase
MRRYAVEAIRSHGETLACRMLRSRLAWFAKGLPQASRFRMAIRHLSSDAEVVAAIDDLTARLMGASDVEEPWGE